MNEDVRTILLVEDDEANRHSVTLILEQSGYLVLSATNGHEALDILRKSDIDLILSDLKMPLMDGMDVLKSARLIRPEVDVIIMTAHGTIETAVEAIKEGAYDFLAKPFKKATLLRTIEKSLERRSLVRENTRLKEALKQYESQKGIIGQSPAIRHVLDMISQVSSSSSTILIQGESGTGKELVAEAIHQSSPITLNLSWMDRETSRIEMLRSLQKALVCKNKMLTILKTWFFIIKLQMTKNDFFSKKTLN